MNRFLARQEKGRTSNKHGRISERKAMKGMGVRQTPGSGAMDGCKSDGYSQKFRFENKATSKGSFSVKYGILDKIRKEAMAHGQMPVLSLSFVTESGKSIPNGDFIILKRDDFMSIVEEAYGEDY